jgi:alpha-glucoside transport system substrate-binding protein
MRRAKWLLLLVVFAMVVAACSDDDSGDTTTTAADADMVDVSGTEFTLLGLPVGDEGKAMVGFLDAYNAEKDTNITFTGSDDMESQLRIRVEGGDPPDMAALAQPGSICPYAEAGELASLEDMGFDIAQLEDQFGKFWVDLGVCADGMHYGVPWFPNYKSIVFYHEPTFAAQGYEIPFNDPAVVAAFDTFGELIFAEGFVLGGSENIAGVAVTDSPGPLFNDPPGCLMLKQGSFARNWMVDLTGYTPEKAAELKVFPFPTIDGNAGAMGGGDTLIVFNGTPENAQLVKDWITPDWQCTLASYDGGGVSPYGGHGVEGVERLPANRFTDLNCLNSEENQFIAQAVWDAMAANGFVFDASDLMPPAVGQGSFWTGMVDFTRGTSSQAVADAVESSWP